MHRRTELSLPRALWIVFVQRPRPVRRAKRQRWGIRIWWWPFLLVPVWGWVFAVWEAEHDAPGYGWGFAGATFWTLIVGWFVFVWWDNAHEVRKANKRRGQCSWALLERKIANLEKELGFGEYDTIQAIEWIQARQTARRHADADRARAMARGDEAAARRIAARQMEEKHTPPAEPFEGIDLDGIERSLLAEGVIPCRRGPGCPLCARVSRGQGVRRA
jgi:hypothetical protein